MDVEWRLFSNNCTRKAPCSVCGKVSPWIPKGWAFRYKGIRGGKRKGDAKVTTIRICADCKSKQEAGSSQ